MHPVLLEIGKFKIYSYSLMVVVAFSFATLYAWYEARRKGEDSEAVLDLALYIFISAFIGSRLLHCLVNWKIYFRDPLRVLKIWEGGLVYYGGFLLASLVVVIYLKRHKLSLGLWADLLAPCAMISLALGRIGCFLNGCCYGAPAPKWLPGKVVYPIAQMPLHLAGVPLYPTPLYESALTAIIALFLIWRSRHKKFEGEVFWLMVFLYSVVRYFLEYVRGDPRGLIAPLHLTPSQLISVILFGVSLFFLVRSRIKRENQELGR